jgi:hypothetical protein
VAGLLALAVSLARSSGQGTEGSTAAILAWLGGTGLLALLALSIGRRTGTLAAAMGIAGGLLFSIGDFSTKLATQGDARLAFVITLIVGYTLGTSLLQLGYQRGAALTVAGLATLLTDALPIAAGTIVLREPVPSGLLGVLRIVAFAAVTAGAILLASPERQTGQVDEASSSSRSSSTRRRMSSRIARTSSSGSPEGSSRSQST